MRYIRTLIIMISLSLFLIPINLKSAFDRTFMGNARYIALSGAYAGLSDDEASIFVNPAGITRINYIAAGITGGDMYAGLDFGTLIQGNFSGAVNLEKYGAVGLGINHFSVGVDDNISYSESLYVLSYGYMLSPGKSIGINFKIPRWSSDLEGNTLYSIPTTAIGIDVGIVIIENDRFSMGAVIYDINQPKIGYTGVVQPFSAKFGFSYSTLKNFLIFDVDANYINDNIDLAGGAEVLFNKSIFVRAGIYLREITDGMDFSLGAGYSLNLNKYIINFDYGFRYSITDLTGNFGTHFFTTSIKFNSAKSKKINSASKTGFTKSEEEEAESMDDMPEEELGD